MNLNRHDPRTELAANSTPLIDVVFLLIIFFMVITDLTQQDLEDLELPDSVAAVPDEPGPEARPVINVLQDGRVVVRGDLLFDPENDRDPAALEAWLVGAARRMPTHPEDGTPDGAILVRADRGTPFAAIQAVLSLCGKEGIRISGVEFAASLAED